LSGKQTETIDPARFIGIYDRHEHALEQSSPHRSFRSVSADALRLALDEPGLQSDADDARTLADSISAMPPFPRSDRCFEAA
jgi:2-haloacid dehalogenase